MARAAGSPPVVKLRAIPAETSSNCTARCRTSRNAARWKQSFGKRSALQAHYRRTHGLSIYVRIENSRATETVQSPACVTVTGYTPEEFASNPNLWIQIVVPEDRERVTKHVQQILAGEDVSSIEHRIIRKSGETRWISDTTILFRDASGKLLSYDGVIKDITERKSAEVAIYRLNEELEDKVEARTSDLEQARHIAEQANRAKSDFLAAMSHEIRTPMNGVIGMIDVLQQSSLNSQQWKWPASSTIGVRPACCNRRHPRLFQDRGR